MIYLMVRHKVADFPKWKAAYDAHRPARDAAGLRETHLLHSLDDPNELVLMFTAEDLKKAQEFAASADLREAMKNAGVFDKPDLYFLN